MTDELIRALRTPAADLRANPPTEQQVMLARIFGGGPPPEYKQTARGTRRKVPEMGTGTVQDALYESLLGYPSLD